MRALNFALLVLVKNRMIGMGPPNTLRLVFAAYLVSRPGSRGGGPHDLPLPIQANLGSKGP